MTPLLSIHLLSSGQSRHIETSDTYNLCPGGIVLLYNKVSSLGQI